MNVHIKYLQYILRHKWFVFQECIKLGVPLWGAIVHDWQKFTFIEWKPYALTFYGPWEYENRPDWLVKRFEEAWLHHQKYGPHHWQYWVIENNDGSRIPREIPDRYRREMLADWRGATRAITGTTDGTKEWYFKNRNDIILHPNTRNWLEAQFKQS